MSPTPSPVRAARRPVTGAACRTLAGLAASVLAACSQAPVNKADTAPQSGVAPEIRKALTEAPRPGSAALPEALARELLPAPELSLAKLPGTVAEPRFDLNVVRLPAAQVFSALARDTRYSMIVDPELKTPVTVALKDVSLTEALETLRTVYGFEYRIEGTRIFVQAAALETRVFAVNYPTESRSGRSEVRVTSSSLGQSPAGGPSAPPSNGNPPPQGGQTSGGSSQESSRITTQMRTDLWNEVDAALHLMIPAEPGKPDGRQLVVSPQSGVIVVRALPRELRQVEQYLHSMRMAIERQIILESKIIEVDLNSGTQTGINWSAFHNGAGARTSGGMTNPNASLSPTGTVSDNLLAATPGTALLQNGASTNALFGIAFQTNNFAALLEFLQTQGELQVLSSPRIAAMNNQQAVLKVGTDDFFVTGVTTNIASGATANGGPVITPTITVQPFFSGVALDITPSIDEDGSVILHVHPSVSSVSERSKVVNLGTLGNYTLPLASSTVSETDTVVRAHDGNIVAIGGLMKTSDSRSSAGMPGLSTVPGLGLLFSSRQESHVKQELVILIKPTVVRSDDQLEAGRAQALERMQAGRAALHL
jgi:MSHA biogenesis protein MshL